MPLLPRFNAISEAIEDERRIAQALLEAGDAPDGNGKLPLRKSADGHHRDRRRGLPVITQA